MILSIYLTSKEIALLKACIDWKSEKCIISSYDFLAECSFKKLNIKVKQLTSLEQNNCIKKIFINNNDAVIAIRKNLDRKIPISVSIRDEIDYEDIKIIMSAMLTDRWFGFNCDRTLKKFEWEIKAISKDNIPSMIGALYPIAKLILKGKPITRMLGKTQYTFKTF